MIDWAATVERMDRAVLGNLGSTTVLYTPAVGAAVSVPGIFDRNQIPVVQAQAGIGKVSPALFVRLSDLPAAPGRSDLLTITASPDPTIVGQTFKISEAILDGHGGCWLFLFQVTS